MTTPIVCYSCGARGKVASVTSGLQCRCGSTDIDLDEGQQVLAGKHDVHPDFQKGFDESLQQLTTHPDDHQEHNDLLENPNFRAGQGNGDRYIKGNTDPHEEGFAYYPAKHQAAAKGPQTGWGKQMPDPLRGWNEYAGPSPTSNPLAGPNLVSNPNGDKCPVCKGSGYDVKDRSVCRECGGTGKYTPMTSAPSAPQVARHPGQTTKPYMAKKVDYETDTFVMTASCPVDGNPTTYLAKDRDGSAWWSCKCGSLANLDESPWVNPYSPPSDFRADNSMKSRRKLGSKKAEPGRLFRTLANVQNNNAVTPREALTLTLEAIKLYPES